MRNIGRVRPKLRCCAVAFLRTPDSAKTQWSVYVGMAPDWIRRIITCYHCSTVWKFRHPIFISRLTAVFQYKYNIYMISTLKSFDKQYIKTIWTTACNEHDILVALTYRKCHRCAMCCRRLRNLGKYAIKFNILNFFRECRLPRLRTILDCVLSRCVFADYLIRDCALC